MKHLVSTLGGAGIVILEVFMTLLHLFAFSGSVKGAEFHILGMVLQAPGSHQIDPQEGVDGGVRWRG